jgi:hypothetical protein
MKIDCLFVCLLGVVGWLFVWLAGWSLSSCLRQPKFLLRYGSTAMQFPDETQILIPDSLYPFQ